MNTNNDRSKRRIWIGGGCIIAVAVLGLTLMLLKQKDALAKETNVKEKEIKNGPSVKVIKAGMNGGDNGTSFIGEARPFQSVTLYAKTSGYMNKILVDKGDKVREGQLLATIISPEIDQQYKAAIADLENKKKIMARDQALVKKDYISKEDAEASETAVSVSLAQVQSLKEQMQYKNITAPFEGTVTARFADAGALVQNATNSQTSAQPIVTLSQLDKIRIYVYVPQGDAAFLKEGYPVTITMQENASLKINATVTRIAGELDPKTRMMLAEIDLQNKENQITPGSYLQVNFKAAEQQYLSIPSEALVLRAGKPFVPVIANGQIHYTPVQIDNNDGVKVSIISGINRGDVVGLNVSPELPDGQKVNVQL